MMFISDCIKSIGELAAENRYLKTTNEAAKSLEKVGLAAVRDRLDEIAIFTLSNLGEVGIKEAQFNLRGCLAIDSIENIAEAAAEQGLNNVLKKAAVSLKEVGIAAAEQKLDFKTSEVLRLLEKIALKVAKLKLKIVAREVVLNLEKVQIVANQQGLVEAMKQAEMSLKKINETLGKSPSNNT